MTMVKWLKNLCHTQLSKLRTGKARRFEKKKAKEIDADSQAYDTRTIPPYAQDLEAQSIENNGPDDQIQPGAIRTFHYSEKEKNTSGAVTKSQTDIDFYRLDNLEDFAKESTVARETIERWVSAGILSPGETKIAEKLIKIMREQEHLQNDDHHGSDSER